MAKNSYMFKMRREEKIWRSVVLNVKCDFYIKNENNKGVKHKTWKKSMF